MLSQEQINSLTLRFQQYEWKWLISLPSYAKSLLAGGNEIDFEPAAFTHYGEFFLTLCGIKPCLLITNPDYPSFAYELYIHAIQPLQEELLGFELFRIDRNNNNISDSPDHFSSSSSSSPLSSSSSSPDKEYSMMTTVPQIVYIFTSIYHPKFSLIKEVLMKPHQEPVPNELLGKALGYPVPCGLSTFYYVDQTTTQELGVGCMVVFEFTARAGFERSIKMHFEKCAAEFRKLGRVLTIACHA
jgi:hypothetical protein